MLKKTRAYEISLESMCFSCVWMLIATLSFGFYVLLKTDGIVIKDSFYSEKDKILTILTSKLGAIRAFVKGCSGIKVKIFLL